MHPYDTNVPVLIAFRFRKSRCGQKCFGQEYSPQCKVYSNRHALAYSLLYYPESITLVHFEDRTLIPQL